MIELRFGLGFLGGLAVGGLHVIMLRRMVDRLAGGSRRLRSPNAAHGPDELPSTIQNRTRGPESLSIWSPFFGLVRLGIVAGTLVLAALWGQILSAAVGWLVGFALLTIIGLVQMPLRHSVADDRTSDS